MKPLNLLGLVFIFTFMAVLSHAEVSTSILGLWGVKNLDDKNLQEHSEMVEGGLEARSKIKFASCLDQSTHLNISSNFMSYEVDGFVCVLPNGNISKMDKIVDMRLGALFFENSDVAIFKYQDCADCIEIFYKDGDSLIWLLDRESNQRKYFYRKNIANPN